MRSGKSINTGIINILIAFLFGLFVIFPDITLMRTISNQPKMGPGYGEYPGEQSLSQQPPETLKPPPPRDNPRRAVSPRDGNAPFRVFSNDSVNKILTDYVFFFVLSLVLLFLNAYNLLGDRRGFRKRYALIVSAGESLSVCVLFIVLYSFVGHRRGVFPVDGMNMFKVFFVGIVSFLFVYVMRLAGQQQKMALENEQLKSENLLAQYNMLAAQINPHFLFNSLNSLSLLVREGENEKSLQYINELSDMFRYVLQANKLSLTILKEELNFLQAYRYMMEIRYEGKLHFDIDIQEKHLTYQIPMLSAQLLIENAIKHNEISEDKPLKVDIYTTDDDVLVISNPIQKKIRTHADSGLGLQNLTNRYQLLTSKSITVENNGETFAVGLPLIPNSHKA